MLKVSNLFFQIGDSRILNDVNFEIKKGEKVGIIGPNGSGKTTVFNCISGFNIPNSGLIEFRGKNITKAVPSQRALLGLGRVFQNFGIFRQMTVSENIITALESKQKAIFSPWSKKHKDNFNKSLEYLELVGIKDKAKIKAGSLSGGQMRLLEITRAIAFGAELFLLDEPTAGVSPKMKLDIQDALKKLQDLGKTIIIIEHDINFIQKLCDRILVLDQGKVVLDGTPESVRNDPRLQDIYFGTEDNNKSGMLKADCR